MRRIESDLPCLDSEGKGHGPAIQPVLRLLKSRENSTRWNANYRGALASAVANRQWPQERCAKAGYAEHSKCLLCLHAAGDTDANRSSPSVPTGTGRHRPSRCEGGMARRRCPMAWKAMPRTVR